MKIGITLSETNFQNYPNWILTDNEDIEIVILSFIEKNYEDLNECCGVILSGGVDTHPRYYQNIRTEYPNNPTNFNETRDEFELNIFKEAFEKKIPILGICRGMQLINIALGGDLVQDLEETGKNDHKKNKNTDALHAIVVNKNSHFFDYTQFDSGVVNSAHHQGLGNISQDLEVVAWSLDDIPEVIELKNNKNYPFFLGVQWHPERFNHEVFSKPFSENIKKHFLNSCRNYKYENN